MAGYDIFDSLLDSVFVINSDKEVVYCNEAAANLLGSSVRRLSKSKKIYEVMCFDDESLFPNETGTFGEDESLPMTEVGFTSVKGNKKGKVQMVMQPFATSAGEKFWVLILRDVTLEEVLHGKYRKQLEEKEHVIDELKQARAELEAYSKNLEQMVEERTAEIKKANTMLNAIMNSLGQGFLVFDESGECSSTYTRACLEVLEGDPEGTKIWDYLRLNGTDGDQFKNWMKAVFSQALPFDSLKTLAPGEYPHSEGKKIDLEYYPIRDQERLSNLVLVATDRTAEFEASLALERERQYAEMVVKLVTNKRQFSQFLSGVETTVKEVESLTKVKPFDYGLVFRILHTLEGEAGAFSASGIRDEARHCQEIIEPLKWDEEDRNDEIVQVLRSDLARISSAYDSLLEENKSLFKLINLGAEKTFEVTAGDLDLLNVELQKKSIPQALVDFILGEIRKEPIGKHFKSFQDIIDQVCVKQGKEMLPLNIKGGDVRVLPDTIDGVLSSLVHAFRNAMDHGIEGPGEREMLGKPRQGLIEVDIKVQEKSDAPWLNIEIVDDGQGINPDVIRLKAKENNPNEDFDSQSDEEVIQSIFNAGLSSKENLSEFSGRGIGMDAIKFEVEKLGGKVWVVSELGKGTHLHINVPMGVAFIDAKSA